MDTENGTRQAYRWGTPRVLLELSGRRIWNVTEQHWLKDGILTDDTRTEEGVALYFDYLTGNKYKDSEEPRIDFLTDYQKTRKREAQQGE
jgi:hypothetical protein